MALDRWRALPRAALALALIGVTVGTASGPVAALSSNPAVRATTLSVQPHAHLVDGQQVSVSVAGGSYGTTYAVVECGPKALLLLAEGSGSLQDGCDSRHNTLMTVATDGRASASLHLPAVLTTALGAVDCRAGDCILAAVALHSTGGGSVLLQPLRFAAGACAAPGSCATPVDAWDPSLGPGPKLGHGPATPRVPSQPPLIVPLVPSVAVNLTAPGSVTGPFTGQPLTGTASAGATVQGDGLLRLALEAPGTSWGPGAPSSTVVDATLTDQAAHQVVSTQQFVLFWGAPPFVYAGFTGPVRTSDHYSLRVAIEPPTSQGGLSQPSPGRQPQVVLLASALEVVSPANPQYLAYAYAPVMYGRSTSALHDVPLLMYANVTPAGGGSNTVSYVIVWSHEDAGTGFLPFLEWGRWGRLTDVEDAISFTVAPNGSVSKARYLWGGEPPSGFPDSQTALQEVDESFTGTWWGHHPVLRDATGNNDFAEHGTTTFRFQLAPVAAPPPGSTRDAVMDANPFTYEVMSDEVARWYSDISTSPTSPNLGQAEQYAIVDLDTSGKGVSSVAVDLRLAGYPQWFRSDLGWGYPLVSTGHVRTVVKLPVGWSSSRLVGVQLAVEPPSAAATVAVHSLHVERFTGTAIVGVPAPPPSVTPEVLDVAAGPSLGRESAISSETSVDQLVMAHVNRGPAH